MRPLIKLVKAISCPKLLPIRDGMEHKVVKALL